PRLLLFRLPSSSINFLSIPTWSRAFSPLITAAMAPLTLPVALRTPFPPYLALSPSRNSHASCSPVLAPLGTAARPIAPPSRCTSTSMVGLPRESRISRALILAIFVSTMTCDALHQLSHRTQWSFLLLTHIRIGN